MGKHRTNDDDLIVFEHQFIDLHRHIHREQTVGQFRNLLRGNNADFGKCRGIIPGVVKKPNLAVGGAALGFRNLQALTNGGFTHRLVRAQRDQDIERLGDGTNLPVQGLEQQSDRRRARAIRDDK